MPPGEVIGTAFVAIRPETEGFAAEAQSKIAAPLQAAFAGIATGVVAVKVKQFFTDTFAEATQAQRASAQTGAVLKSTGEAAGVSAAHVENYAQQLSKVAAVDDEVIQQGENVLLTFTSVRNEVGKGNDVFDRATKAALNISAALGTDLQGSIIQVGKALQDPIQGLTALRRVGVSFTESEVAQIAALQQAGDLLGAQKIILSELERQFGGAAASQATDAQRLSVAYGNLKESIGTALLPVISAFAKVLTPIAGFLSDSKIATTALAVVISGALLIGLAGWTAGAVRATVANLGLASSARVTATAAEEEAVAATGLGAGLGLAVGIMGAAAIAGIGLAHALGQDAHGLELNVHGIERLTTAQLKNLASQIQASGGFVKMSDVIRKLGTEAPATARALVEAADLPAKARQRLFDIIDRQVAAEKRAASASRASAGEMDNEADSAGGLTDKLKGLIDYIAAQEDNSLSLERANLRLDESLDALYVSFNDTSQSANDHRSALLDTKGAVEDYGKAVFTTNLTNTGSSESAAQAQIYSLSLVAGRLAPGSELRVWLDQYIDRLRNGVPAEVRTNFLLTLSNQTGLSVEDLNSLDVISRLNVFSAAGGGYFPAKSGGYLVNVAEGGQDEVVGTPAQMAEQYGGSGGGPTFQFYGPLPPDPITFGHLAAKTHRVHMAMAGR